MKERRDISVHGEAGLLSIDFLIGFTIFMVSLIMVVTMVSGLFVGLQSKTIDYDGVAYRTGVILAEDPGEAVDSVGVTKITPDHFTWELVPEAYQNSNILRLGLSMPKYYFDTPENVWLENKGDTFFSQFSKGKWNNEFYRSKMIFGDYPYQTNITMIMENGNTSSIGDPVPENGYYGYIKRVGLVKHSTYIDSNLTDNFNFDTFQPMAGNDRDIKFKFRNLYIQEPAYQAYPQIENTSVNFTEIPNITDPLKITGMKVCYPSCDNVVPGQADIVVDGSHKGVPTSSNPSTWITLNKTGTNVLTITPAMFDIPNIGPISEINILVTFSNASVAGLDYYDPNSSRFINGSESKVFHETNLTPAWLEVRVW